MTITKRLVKGSPLTNTELDANFTDLDGRVTSAASTASAAAAKSANLSDLANAATARTNLGAQAALVSGTNIKTVNGTSVLGSGDLAIAGSGVTAFSSLTDKATVDLPATNTPLANALNAKADALGQVNIATGATTTSANVDRINVWTGTADGSVTIGSGLSGTYQAFQNPHATAILTVLGGSTPTGKRNTVQPGETLVWVKAGTAWVAQADAGGSSAVVASISPSTATAGAATLTCSFGTGWTSGAFQWFRDAVAISGATSQTYVTDAVADAGKTLTCRAGSTSGLMFTTPGIVVAAPAGSTGSLTEAHRTVTTVDLTALTASGGDWFVERSGSLAVIRKTGANLIVESTVNAGFAGFEHVGAILGYNNGGGADSSSSARAYSPTAGGTGKRTITYPAGTDSRDAFVYVTPDNAQALTIRATLSDGSATEKLVTTPTGTSGGTTTYEYQFTYNAADNSSRTLVVAVETTSYAMVDGAAYAP